MSNNTKLSYLFEFCIVMFSPGTRSELHTVQLNQCDFSNTDDAGEYSRLGDRSFAELEILGILWTVR